jgi:hypothetical protein
LVMFPISAAIISAFVFPHPVSIWFRFNHQRNLIRRVLLKRGITFCSKLRLRWIFFGKLSKNCTYDSSASPDVAISKKLKKIGRHMIQASKFQHQFFQMLANFYRSHLSSVWANPWCYSYFCAPGWEKNIKKTKTKKQKFDSY